MKYCQECGALLPVDFEFPFKCRVCKTVLYDNPLSIVVGLIPVLRLFETRVGLLAGRRTIDPEIGGINLICGHIECKDLTWQGALAREGLEEDGVILNKEMMRLFDLFNSPDGRRLSIFGMTPAVREQDLPPFVSNPESSERIIVYEPEVLCFSGHRTAAERFFREYARDILRAADLLRDRVTSDWMNTF